MSKTAMHKCMSEWKDKHPKGRSDKKMSKKQAQKQAVAVCLDKTNKSLKSLVEGMSFSSFLIVEAMPSMQQGDIRAYIRSLPTYQEMMADQSAKPEALRLAKQMWQEFGDQPVTPEVEDHVFDAFDELSSTKYKGSNLVDWGQEAARDQQDKDEEAIASAADKWEQATGMDAETGAPIKRRMNRGATHQQGKFDQAKREMDAFKDAPAPEQADRLSAAKTQAAGATAPQRGAKSQIARAVFDENFGTEKPSQIIRKMREAVQEATGQEMSKAHATTYYYNFKKKAAQQ